MPTKLVINCETGEVTEVALTDEELAQQAKDALESAAAQAEREAAEAQKAQDRADAIATLTGLGLTEAQIQALLG